MKRARSFILRHNPADVRRVLVDVKDRSTKRWAQSQFGALSFAMGRVMETVGENGVVGSTVMKNGVTLEHVAERLREELAKIYPKEVFEVAVENVKAA